MTKPRCNAENAEAALRPQGNIARLRRAKRADSFLRVLFETPGFSVLSLLRGTLVAALAIGIAGCGTKTELLKPDGKPTPRDERDPSQPPSPISR